MVMFTASDGCQIYYDLFGSKGALIVFIPGLGGDGRFWGGVVKELQDDYRLLVVDHRGSGRSARPQGHYTLTQIAMDCADIIKRLGEPAHIVGHSAGGAVAQELALAAPELGLSYSISSSWARPDAWFRAIFTARCEMLKPLSQKLAPVLRKKLHENKEQEHFVEPSKTENALEAGLVRAYQQLSHVFCYDRDYLAAHEVELAKDVEEVATVLAPLSVAAARVRMLLDHDRLDDLAAIKAPVQIIAAQDDILIPPALSQAMLHQIRGAKFISVKGAHFHPKTHPQEFAALMRDFMRATLAKMDTGFV